VTLGIAGQAFALEIKALLPPFPFFGKVAIRGAFALGRPPAPRKCGNHPSTKSAGAASSPEVGGISLAGTSAVRRRMSRGAFLIGLTILKVRYGKYATSAVQSPKFAPSTY
jgi:hypothetical protein